MKNTPKPITLVMPYYENPGVLAEHQRIWSEYSDKLKALLHVIVVDDGSPTRPALPHIVDCGLASFRLYRIGLDIRWNWIACRNLAMAECQTEWALLTDIDHAMPEKTLKALTYGDHVCSYVYRLPRVDAPKMTPYKNHPNTWFLTRQMYDRIGGYDERFSGYYGTDADFRERVHEKSQQVVVLNCPLIRYPREVIPDASTTTYGRKEPQDRENVMRIRAERDAVPDWRPLRGSFPWERLL